MILKLHLIVSVGADFGDWQGGGYDSGYAKGRSKMVKCHVTQLEANMTLLGLLLMRMATTADQNKL
jgi:molybdopterin-containing oxidoreductase family iron-sulfur binding subunit